MAITYEVVYPTAYLVSITENSTNIVFDIDHEYNLGEVFTLEYLAKFNSTLYTRNKYTITVQCREECLYCDNTESCIV
jgi:hypothetical protein